MDASGCEHVIERAMSRGKLKLRGRSALLGLSAASRTHPGNRQDDLTRQHTSALPKCRPSANARNAAMITWLSFFAAPTEDPGPAGDGSSFSRSGCRSRLHGWIPMAVDGTSAPGAKNFPLPVSPASGDPRPAFLAHAPTAPKFVAPAGAQRCACPPLASGGSGSVSSSRP